MLFVLFILGQCVMSQDYLTGYGKSYPVEIEYDKSFNSFLNKLIKAVENYDKNYIYSVIDPEIDLGPDADYRGVNGFKKLYNLNDNNSDFWSINKRLLIWGGSYSSSLNEYCFPYNELFNNYSFLTDCILMGNCEYNVGIAIGSNVAIYNMPEIESNVIGYLNYEVVKSLYFNSEEWSKILFPNNLYGYVKKKDLYEYLGDYCICFKKKKSKWLISLFSKSSI